MGEGKGLYVEMLDLKGTYYALGTNISLVKFEKHYKLYLTISLIRWQFGIGYRF